MQRTPNLGLPQFEPSDKYRLEDYNEAYMKIDEKVKELNDKEAQLDTKLAEAQSIIDTWETFKNTGGTISGDVDFSTGLNARRVSLKNDQNDFFSFITLNDTTIGIKFNDSILQTIDRFGEFYIGGYSKEPNGFTKLPNGLILQWGNHQFLDKVNEGVFESTYSVRMPIRFPIAFPNKILSFSSTSDRVAIFSAFSDVTNSSCTLFATSMVNANISVGIRWIAIGY